MARRIHLQPHLSREELERRYRTAQGPTERTWWQILWSLAQGHTATELSRVIGSRAYWIGQIAKRYNEQGPEAMRNRRHTTSYRPPPVLSPALQARRDVIRSTTCFHWWPRQIHTRLGPRRNEYETPLAHYAGCPGCHAVLVSLPLPLPLRSH